MPQPDPAVTRLEDVLERFMLAASDLAREEALFDATETAKDLLREGQALDQVLDVHRRAQQALAGRWCVAEAVVGYASVEAALGARDRLARGDGLPLMLALMLPYQLAEQACHEQRWREEHGKRSALFEHADAMILGLNKRGHIDTVNPAFTQATGWSSIEAMTRMDALWRGPLPARSAECLSLEQVRKDGSRFMAEWSISPILGRDGELLSYVCVGRDISRRQQIEDSLRENDKLRAVATLAGGIAHDFNNLLGSILGLAELCELEAAPGSRQARNLGRIRQAGAKAATLVRQMLDFSRQTPRTEQRLYASEWLSHAEGLLRATLPQQVTLVLRVDEDGPVSIDLVQMEQVLINIVRNAADALQQRPGEIHLVVDRVDPGALHAAAPPGAATANPMTDHVRLRVIDTGEGIAPDVLPKIFEPFFTTKPVGEGTGLGLAAVHGIVSNHGGVIEVDSLPGCGTTFSVFLPLAPPLAQEDDAPRAEAAQVVARAVDEFANAMDAGARQP
jgi:PAS domain S-box-containing protein